MERKPIKKFSDSPEKSSPANSTPDEKSTPEKSTPEMSSSEKSTPEKSTPKKSTPKKNTPEMSTPEMSSSEKSTPKKSSPQPKRPPQKRSPQKNSSPKRPPLNKIEGSARAKLKNPPPLDLPLLEEWHYCDDVMTLLKVSRDVLNNFIETGILLTHKWGGTVRINKAYLDFMIVNGMRIV